MACVPNGFIYTVNCASEKIGTTRSAVLCTGGAVLALHARSLSMFLALTFQPFFLGNSVASGELTKSIFLTMVATGCAHAPREIGRDT